MMQRRVRSACARAGLVAGLLLAATAAVAQAQGESTWRARWMVGLGSSFDTNAFRLSSGQRSDLVAGDDRYLSLSQPYDVRNRVRVGFDLRGRGLAGKRLDVESDVRVDVYTFNRRRTSVRAEVEATQRLTKRDHVRLGVVLRQSQFRRDYLTGEVGGVASYGPGIATTLGTELAYQRTLMRGKRGRPELDVELGVVAGRRSYRDLPWRDRAVVGAGAEVDLRVGRVGLEASASAARVLDGFESDEPVRTDAGVVMVPLRRGFDELELDLEASFRTGKESRVALEYGLRERHYTASLSEDPYYGDRQDRRHTLGSELRLDVGRRTRLLLGAEHQFQTTFRPGRGDTGDEADYRRTRASLTLEYRP